LHHQTVANRVLLRSAGWQTIRKSAMQRRFFAVQNFVAPPQYETFALSPVI
jgi:hypothetical protein